MNRLARRARRLAPLLCAATLACGVLPASAHAATAQEAIAFLNAQREANGIPGGIVENPTWSEGCRLHIAYRTRNGSGGDPHSESPSLPLYTPLGDQAARSSVLAPGGFLSDGRNPWENAPIHLMQLLGPRLSTTGYADGCMWTWPGYQRPDPPFPVLHSYPGEGNERVPHAQNAAESPFVPGDFVGLPEGTTTGPHLYVLAAGTERGRLTAASLTGPDGPVEVRTVDDGTGGISAYLPPGGIVIPVSPLRPDAPYTASVSFTDGVVSLSRTWSFRTRPDPQDASPALAVERSGLTFASSNPSPARLTVVRLPSGTVVLDTTVALSDTGVASVPLSLLPARHRVCALQPATRAWLRVRRCVTVAWRISTGARWERRGPGLVVFRSGHAAGRRAYTVFQPLGKGCRRGRCRWWAGLGRRERTLRLPPVLRVRLGPAPGYRLRVMTADFVRDDVLYHKLDTIKVLKR